ncbi:MAG: hypothetical protein GXO66_09725 [Euryarchaeota archaeon]|nr:hypothetical protein [Euryarchaeota archaeon]
MNEYAVTALVVLLTLGVGVALLLTFGISFVSYLAVGVILSVLLASLVYTWWKSKTDRTVVLLKIEILNKIKDAVEVLERNLRAASEMVDVEPFMEDLAGIKRGLISRGFFTGEFQINEGKIDRVTLTAIELESRKVEQQLRSLESLVVASYGEAVAGRMQELLDAAQMLVEGGFSVREEYEELRRVASMPAASLQDLLEKRRRGEEQYGRLVERCIREAEFLLTTAEGVADVSHLREELERVKREREKVESVYRLLRVRSEVSSYLTRPFLEAREEVLAYLDRMLELSRGFERERQVLRELRERAKSYTDPGQLAEFRSIRQEAKRLTLELARAMAREISVLDEELRKLGRAVEGTGAGGRISELDPRREFREFAGSALEVLTALAADFSRRYREVKIARNYPAVERIISRKLAEAGRVSAGELGVRYAEEFLRLYSESHPEAVLEGKVLRLKG